MTWRGCFINAAPLHVPRGMAKIRGFTEFTLFTLFSPTPDWQAKVFHPKAESEKAGKRKPAANGFVTPNHT